MKKLLLTALFALALTACSTENTPETEAIVQTLANKPGAIQNDGNEAKGFTPGSGKNSTLGCWIESTAHYENAGSFASPKWNFIADVPQTAPTGSAYKVTLEIQATDGEDITIGYGNIISITDNIIYNNISVVAPAVARYPSALLQWYRWRLRITGINSADNSVKCEQVTPWYDNPLG
jgi:hypothetical protein